MNDEDLKNLINSIYQRGIRDGVDEYSSILRDTMESRKYDLISYKDIDILARQLKEASDGRQLL